MGSVLPRSGWNSLGLFVVFSAVQEGMSMIQTGRWGSPEHRSQPGSFMRLLEVTLPLAAPSVQHCNLKWF